MLHALEILLAESQRGGAEELGIAVPKGNEALLGEINKFVKKYTASENYKKDYAYWFVDMKWWDSVPQKKK